MTSFFIGFCVLCAAVSAIKPLFPEAEMKQMISYFFALTVIVLFITNIAKVEFDFNEFSQLEIEQQEISDQVYAAAARPVIAAILEDGKIPFEKIEVISDKTENGSIVISKVVIFTQEEYIEKAEELIRTNTDIEKVEAKSD